MAAIGTVDDPTLYEDPPDHRKTLEPRFRDARLGAWALIGTGVVIALFVPAGFEIDVAFGIIFVLMFAGCAFLGVSTLREISSYRPHKITSLRVYGQGLPTDGLLATSIRSVHSTRYARDHGIFLLTLNDGSKRRIGASNIADPDTYWEALKSLVADAKGWEWVGGEKRYYGKGGR